MPSRDELIGFMDDLLRKDDFTDHCPIGLQVEGKAEVRKVATGVSACMALFEQAAAWGTDMIAVHHGMLWDRDDHVLRGHVKARIKFLLDRDLTLVAYHIPLDAHPEIGNNALFAGAMEFENIEPFGEYDGKLIGYRGSFHPPLSIDQFVARASDYYGSKPRAFLGGKPEIGSAAVISGGAWTGILEAARKGVDCFVTGNVDEPVPHLAHEERVNFLAFGHYATERNGIRRLGEVLAEEFDVEARFFDVDNPL